MAGAAQGVDRNLETDRGDGLHLAAARCAHIEVLHRAVPRWYAGRCAAMDRVINGAPEFALVRHVAGDVTHPGWRFALATLGIRGTESTLGFAADVLRVDEPGADRGRANRHMTGLPGAVAVEVVPKWWDLTDGRRAVADSIMGLNVEPEGGAVITSSLAESGNHFAGCCPAETLGRLPSRVPHPELDPILQVLADSYARTGTVAATLATYAGFTGRRAEECLWDCEPAPGTVQVASTICRE